MAGIKLGYLILGDPMPHSETDPAYRGTYRCTPSYIDELDEKHPANQAFFWFIDETDMETGRDNYVHDLDKAKIIVDEYAKHGRFFEIVAVYKNHTERLSEGLFFGYDLSHIGGYSLLSWDLFFRDFREIHQNPHALDSILYLIESYFRPKLNGYRLFSDYETAHFCFDVMMTMQKLVPNLFEANDFVFEVVGLYSIYSKLQYKGCPETLS